jgi:hypothetical protein
MTPLATARPEGVSWPHARATCEYPDAAVPVAQKGLLASEPASPPEVTDPLLELPLDELELELELSFDELEPVVLLWLELDVVAELQPAITRAEAPQAKTLHARSLIAQRQPLSANASSIIDTYFEGSATFGRRSP